MNLNDVVKQGVETAFQAAADFVIVGTYTYRGTDAVYDPTLDTITAGETTVNNVRFIRTKATAEEREASPVAIGDVKLIVPASDIPGVTPTETDTLVLAGVPYNVLAVQRVPGDSVWIIMARQK